LALLYFDCFSGASGDMILGALIDAGLPLDDVRRALGSLAIDRDAVWTERVVRSGITATKFNVRSEDPLHAQTHDHDQQHRHGGAAVAVHAHTHRSLGEIGRLIDSSALSASGKARAKELFTTLGEAESAIHGTPIEKVHLHEVGALDSIIDIVGAVYGLESLGIDRVVSSPLNVGSGTVRTAHGVYPVPAPATARLLTGVPVYSGAHSAELVTPTGALIVSAYATSYGPIPPMKVRAIGYGAGSRDFADTPNVLRVLVGDADQAASVHTIVMIEAEIDDMNPQIFGVVMEQLLAEGALDVYYTPIQMKKNRPGTLLSIVAPPDARERLTGIVFRETTTIGVRYTDMKRECLDRETIVVNTRFGPVRIKIARQNGQVLNASPEFEDCARLAAEQKVPLKDVQAAAAKAFLDRQ
jgi:uncharacterized protein (TIGR00299 family) protein